MTRIVVGYDSDKADRSRGDQEFSLGETTEFTDALDRAIFKLNGATADVIYDEGEEEDWGADFGGDCLAVAYTTTKVRWIEFWY